MTLNNYSLNDIEIIKNLFKNEIINKINILNISKKDLAKHINTSTNTIRNVIRNKNCNFDTVLKIAIALDIKIN